MRTIQERNVGKCRHSSQSRGPNGRRGLARALSSGVAGYKTRHWPVRGRAGALWNLGFEALAGLRPGAELGRAERDLHLPGCRLGCHTQ